MKYKMFNDIFEVVDDGISINGKIFPLEKCEQFYQDFKRVNIIHRPSGLLFYQAFVKNNYPKTSFIALED